MTAVWDWPQITVAVLMGIGLTRNLLEDGQARPAREGKYSFMSTCVEHGILFTLLWFGGFWVR